MGKLRPGSIRHIVDKLHRYNEREIIREKASELRYTLTAKNYTVKSQVPFDVMEKRKPLYSVFEAEKAKGNRCKFVSDKLYVNGDCMRRRARLLHLALPVVPHNGVTRSLYPYFLGTYGDLRGN